MSDYHILGGLGDGNRFRVVQHFPVNDVVNEVGINYRLALLESLGGSQLSIVPFIDGAEQTQLNTGELYEHMITFSTHPGKTLVQKQVRLDALWETEKVKVQAELQYQLSFWGHSRDVP